ncbi:hypothetical protein [Massilioclostridium coli]|uniref:hypothetical protein n=1 Tax=Massilioclostridium coli TaxID=1870991 RepID=UPI00085BED6A|nr:hypothetical protein [Massilioclostridium coli]
MLYNPIHLQFPEIEMPEPCEYEDTYFKDMADDIKNTQEETNKIISQLVEDSKKTDAINRKIAIATLVISILTLIATIVGIIVSILQ